MDQVRSLVDTALHTPFAVRAGDHNWFGWGAFTLYVLAAWLCFRCFWTHCRSHHKDPILTCFWFGCLMLMIAFAANKQLDIHHWVAEVARRYARQEGWYEQRQTFQKSVLIAIGLGCTAGITLCTFVLRRSWGEVAGVIIGMAVLLAFVLMRAVSFHWVDHGLRVEIANARVSHIIELTGLLIICTSAWLSHRLTRTKNRISLDVRRLTG